jgi:hypothetical protein
VLADALLDGAAQQPPGRAADDAGADVALAAVDASTGEVTVLLGAGGGRAGGGAGAFEPAELLLPASWLGREVPGADGASRTYRPDWLFDAEHGRDELRGATR